jgi:hypothetical protein
VVPCADQGRREVDVPFVESTVDRVEQLREARLLQPKLPDDSCIGHMSRGDYDYFRASASNRVLVSSKRGYNHVTTQYLFEGLKKP